VREDLQAILGPTGSLNYILREAMATSRVSKRFAERVSGYASDGLNIPSAEGAGISRSKKSVEEGVKLAEKSLNLRAKRRLANR
jgi:hypothetical protein